MTGRTERNNSIILVALSYSIWGIQAIYWHMFNNISSMHLLAWRIVWAAVFCFILLLAKGKLPAFTELVSDRRVLQFLILSSFAYVADYVLFTYSFVSGHVMDASIGGFLTPLLSFILSAAVFKERGNKLQNIAIIVAAAGVAVLIIGYRKIPLLAVAIAVCATLFGFTKKLIHDVDSILSIAFDNIAVLPLFIVIGGICFRNEHAVISNWQYPLLIAGGLVTMLPLVIFAAGVKKINFRTLGFLQYLSPLLSLAAAFILNENVDPLKIASISIIGVSVMLFAIGNKKEHRVNVSVSHGI